MEKGEPTAMLKRLYTRHFCIFVVYSSYDDDDVKKFFITYLYCKKKTLSFPSFILKSYFFFFWDTCTILLGKSSEIVWHLTFYIRTVKKMKAWLIIITNWQIRQHFITVSLKETLYGVFMVFFFI